MKSEIEVTAAANAQLETAIGALDRVVALYNSPNDEYLLERERVAMIRRMLEFELTRESLDHRLETLHTEMSELRAYLQAAEERMIQGMARDAGQDVPEDH